MKRRNKVLLILSAVTGVIGCGTLYLYTEALQDDHEALVAEQVEVVRLARPLRPGEKLTREMVTTKKIPRRFVGADTVLESDLDRYLGAEARSGRAEGTMLLSRDFDGTSPPAPTRRRVRRKRKAKSVGIEIIRGDRSTAPDPPSAARSSTEQYTDYGVNPWKHTLEDRLSTFSVDVDTASYALARKKLFTGQLPPASAVRVEEFVNYFAYEYPEPDGAFGVHHEAAPSPFATEGDRYLLRIGVQGKSVEIPDRRPTHLTFLIDVSGSMRDYDKLPLAARSLEILVDQLRPEDTVGIVTYANDTRTVLEHTSAARRGEILSALDGLSAGGSTGMSDGLRMAYQHAVEEHRGGHTSRVVVLSDGDANVGETRWDEMLEHVASHVADGVTLSTIGLGTGDLDDTTLEQLADRGNGNYHYVDTLDEALKVFGEEVNGTLEIIARDVKLQAEFDPSRVARYRLVGYENRKVADRDFRNDSVDAGEIGAGHTVTALYELELVGPPDGTIGAVRVRHRHPETGEVAEDVFPIQEEQFHERLADASTDFRFAASVAAFAEKLRGSSDVSYAWVDEVASGAVRPEPSSRHEFLTLVNMARKLEGRL